MLLFYLFVKYWKNYTTFLAFQVLFEYIFHHENDVRNVSFLVKFDASLFFAI